jgi:hypothetical protein
MFLFKFYNLCNYYINLKKKMNDQYKIIDTRDLDSFKQKTFSGYKKNDVISAVLKSIETKKVENACNWCAECIVSGYALKLWEKLIIFGSRIIHINNPNLPFYLLKKNRILFNQVERLGRARDNVLLLRNSQMIRNLFFDVVSTLTTSSKTKRYDKLPKIDEKEDFQFHNIQKRLCAQMNILPDNIMHFNDPDELRIIINEFFTLLKNKQFGYDKCCYWVVWLIKWEQMHKKKKSSWTVDVREVQGVPSKFCADVIWVLWETIFEEMKIRSDDNISKHIQSLYGLFKFNYSSGKRNTRLPLLFNAIGYLTHHINYNIPVRADYKIFIQVQGNLNKMFMSKKISEVNVEIKEQIQKESKKKMNQKQLDKKHDVEIVENKIHLFNELDSIIMGM